MIISEIIDLVQIIVSILALLVASMTAYFAYRIGKRQNEINATSLSITNFVEIFLMPQQVIVQEQGDSTKQTITWKILIKNVSAYPIYLNGFILNGIKYDIGNSAIPNQPDSWYSVPITKDIQLREEFSLTVLFEDYLGRRYSAEGFGRFDGVSWLIRSKKRVEI